MTTLLAFILSAPLQVAPTGPPLIAPEGPLQRTESVRHRFTVTITINYSPAGTPSTPWTMLNLGGQILNMKYPILNIKYPALNMKYPIP